MANTAQISEYSEVIDARSPAEYAEDHIPGAINLPAFDNAERAAIGTLHKTDPFTARRRGAELLSANLARHLGESLADRPPEWAPLVYCARGGQRSGGMVEVLRRIGWQAEQLHGGYKAYRQYVIATIRERAAQCRWVVVAGKTGVGKTHLLEALRRRGAQVVDLEGMAAHRGSVFGLAGAQQPAQRKFETRLCAAVAGVDISAPVFVEAESRKIGDIHVPAPLLAAIRSAPAVLLEAELEARVCGLVKDYEVFCKDRTRFAETIAKLAPFAGNARVAAWQAQHDAGEWHEMVSDLLVNFYDIGYEKSLRTNYPAARDATFAMDPTDEASIDSTAEQLIRHAAG